ncbi:MAG TPA: ASCH domain-containing protein [Gaiellaceae bacterium]|nr:ASCH domain-containing protein [Gaiellaceae bacterium]
MGPARLHPLARAPRRARAGRPPRAAAGGDRELSDGPPLELGWPGTDLRRQLVDAVLRGEKTATAGLFDPDDPHGRPGDRCLLLGFDDEPVGIVELTEVRVVPAREIDLRFARDEGEGFESVEEWREAHERFFEQPLTHDTQIVAVRFRLVERL